MKAHLLAALAVSLICSSAFAFPGLHSKNRMPASDVTPDQLEKMRQDPEVKKSIEYTLKLYNSSGSFTFCDTPGDLGQAIALVFEGVPYRISHMVAVSPVSTSNSGATSGQVCVVVEKPHV